MALHRFNAYYASKFDTNPVATLVIANGSLTTFADAFAQTLSRHLEGHDRPYDYKRTARFAVFGMAMGPPIGGWLKLLDRTFPFPAAGSHVPATVKRVLADQIVFAPFGLVLFTGSMGLMEGKSKAELQQKFKDVYWPALKTNWTVWPFIQAVNFSIVPLPFRLPFQQTCGIAWNSYLSLLNARDVKQTAAGMTEEVHHLEDQVSKYVHNKR